jgi:hypothetical protein
MFVRSLRISGFCDKTDAKHGVRTPDRALDLLSLPVASVASIVPKPSA